MGWKTLTLPWGWSWDWLLQAYCREGMCEQWPGAVVTRAAAEQSGDLRVEQRALALLDLRQLEKYSR